MEFNLDKVKGLLGQLKDKGSEVAGTAAGKAKDAARLAKLTVDINSEKEALKKAYLELGKAYFEGKHDDADGVLAQLVGEAEAVKGRLDALQKEIEELKETFKPEEAASFEDVVSAAEEKDVEVEIVAEAAEEDPAEEIRED